MFLPIGDEPNPRGTAWVNWTLIGLNVLIFVCICFPQSLQPANPHDPLFAQYVRQLAAEMHVSVGEAARIMRAYDLTVFAYGFKPAAPSLLSLFVSMFLHAGWLHLLGNMLFLYIFGDNVELHFGRVGYLLIYLLTGMVATLFFALFRFNSGAPLIGASGAISGVLGCYFVWFPRNRVRVLMVLFWFIDIVSVPARWVLGFYLVIENLLPFLLGSSGDGVAYGAHIGGFLGGAGFATLFDRWQQRGARQFAAAASVPDLQFHDAVHREQWDMALRQYAVMSAGERQRVRDEDVFELADGLTESRRYEPALALLQRFIATHPHAPTLSRAHLRAGLILLRGLQRLPAASQHLLTVLDLNPMRDVEQAARLALADIASRQQKL